MVWRPAEVAKVVPSTRARESARFRVIANIVIRRDVAGAELDSGEAAVEDDAGVFRGVLALLGRERAVDPLAVALRPARAQQEHGQALVVMAPFANLLALVEDGPGDAATRAGERVLLDPVHRIIDRRIPAAAEVHAA